ncbi:DUF2827 domain-containing protein [Variovorax sp. PAMC26660]|uniref:DUF2827 domain-containing protein n=1 Tax=Variovorax sp. PAMC26660 TaxID=2762322 RepID=UPI00164E194F|nr:DUF2827 domain-containing protein [Variovorax sp. PAMC26660]QNK65540.1 DUF2827 domain-containing protein [Variovorax sp. PAMC26660]
MRIGISVITRAGQSIWENGLGQNVVFLARLFQQLPFVQSVVLIDVGDQQVMPAQVDLNALGLRLMRAHEATDEVDVIIEMAGALDPQWLALQRARGKKVVYYCAGQPYAALIEPAVFDKPGLFSRPDRCDEIWLLPEYQTFASFQRVLHRCPVRVVPYLWHPQFLEQRIAEVTQLGHRFGWQTGVVRAGLRVAIFEPNVSVAKTSSISMLACDEAYRAEPGSVAMMNVLNTLHMKDHPTMLYFANQLDLVQQHKALFLGRHDIVGFMVQSADAVVSHQWTNDQNYSYLDALYGDYPLVHNSPWLHGFGAGYYYPGFEAAEGGRQLRIAASEHDTRLEDYRQRSRQVFDAVDPFNAANVEAYARLLLDLQAKTPVGVTA